MFIIFQIRSGCLLCTQSNFKSTTQRNCRLKRSQKERFLLATAASGAPPAAPASNGQNMQRWALAPRELTWLARPLVTDLDIWGQAPLIALPTNRTIHLYPPYK